MTDDMNRILRTLDEDQGVTAQDVAERANNGWRRSTAALLGHLARAGLAQKFYGRHGVWKRTGAGTKALRSPSTERGV